LPVEVDDALVNQLRAAYDDRCDIGEEDMSLIAVAILKSEGVNKVGLLSLDEDLLDCTLAIRSRRQIAFEGSQLSTKHLVPEYGLTFLSSAHDCCAIETPQFKGLTIFVESGDIERLEDFGMKKSKRKFRQFLKIWEFLVESARCKEQQRAAGPT